MLNWITRFWNWFRSLLVLRSRTPTAFVGPPRPTWFHRFWFWFHTPTYTRKNTPSPSPPTPLPTTPPVAKPATTPTKPNRGGKKIMPQPYPLTLFWGIVLFVGIVVFAVDVALGFLTFNNSISPSIFSAIIGIQVVYVFFSFRIIKENQIGARIFLGNPLNNLTSGPTFVPLLLFTLLRAPKTVIQQELPADPQFIWRGVKTPDGKTIQEQLSTEQIEQGFRLPMRITFKKGDATQIGPLYEELTAEITPVVAWHIVDLCVFLGSVGTIEDLRKRLEDACEGYCTSKLTTMTYRDCLNNLDKLSEELRVILDKLVTDWGVEMDSAQLKQAQLSHELNSALQSGATEAARAIGVERAAEGQKRKLILEGEGTRSKLESEGGGKGEAERLVLTGRTDGLLYMADMLDAPLPAVMASEVARAVSDHPGQTIIVGGDGLTQFVGMAAKLTEAVKKSGETQPTT